MQAIGTTLRSSSKPAPKPEPKVTPRAEPKPAPKPEPKTAPKAEPKPTPKPEPKAEPKPAAALTRKEEILTPKPVPKPVPVVTAAPKPTPVIPATALQRKEEILTPKPVTKPVPVVTPAPKPTPVIPAAVLQRKEEILTPKPVPKPVPVATPAPKPTPTIPAAVLQRKEEILTPKPVQVVTPAPKPTPVIPTAVLQRKEEMLTPKPVTKPVPVATPAPKPTPTIPAAVLQRKEEILEPKLALPNRAPTTNVTYNSSGAKVVMGKTTNGLSEYERYNSNVMSNEKGKLDPSKVLIYSDKGKELKLPKVGPDKDTAPQVNPGTIVSLVDNLTPAGWLITTAELNGAKLPRNDTIDKALLIHGVKQAAVTSIAKFGVKNAADVKLFIKGGLKTLDDLLPSGVTKEMLIDTASTSGKGGVTPIGRAFQKHNSGNRAGTFVGEVTGNPGKNTQQGLDYLNDILGNPNATLVAKEHKQFGNIIDIRLPDGTGVRFTADGQTFIGFLEKYTPKK